MDFDRVYEQERADLYVALALSTGSRDLATDTVDDAFRIWHSRVLRRRLPEPPHAAVMWEALKRIARLTRKGTEAQQGFRLRNAPLQDDLRRTLRELRALPLAHRTALVLERHTGWDTATVAAATGIDSESVENTARESLETMGRALDVDSETAAEMLDQALVTEASGFREPLSRLSGTKSTGMLQRFGRATAALGAVVIAAGGLVAGIAAIDFTSDDPEAGAVTTSATTSPVPTGPPTLVETKFEWASGALPIRPNGGDVRSVTAVGTGVVIVGMEYTDRPQVIVARSDDGVDWELLGAPFVGDGDLVGMAATEDLFVAAGNRWNGGEGSVASLYISTDGFDWVETPIPTPESVLVRDVDVRVSTWVQSVNVIGDEIVVGVQSNAELDERLIADLIPGGFAQGGWGLSEDGVQVFDRVGQGTFFSWDELGLTDEEIAVVAPGSRLISSSDQGETWVELGAGLRGNIISLAGTPDLVGAVVSNQFGPQLWIRTEGEWSSSELDLHVSSLASHGGHLYAAGIDDGGVTSLWRSVDGEAWQVVLENAGDGQPAIGASSSGLVAWSSQQFFGRIQPTEVEIDGFRVQLFNEGGIRVFDPETGDVVAELSRDRVFSSGGPVVVENEAGEPLFELSPQDLEVVLFQEDMIVEPGFPGGGGGVMSVFTSDNGLNWNRVVLEGLLPETFAAFNGAPLGDGVALLGWDQRGEGLQIWIGSPTT